jgi:glycosyltransferase involved in cell wall biosynthesis
VKPRIAIFLPNLAGGGAERIMLALAQAFSGMGVDCDLVVASASGELASEVPHEVRLVDLRGSKPIRSVAALARYFRAERPVGVLATIQNANIAVVLAARFALSSRPRVVLCEANPSEFDSISSSRLHTFTTRAMLRYCYSSADEIIAISEGVRESLVRFLEVDDKIVSVIPNPFIPEAADTQSQHRWRAPNRIVACGRLQPQKDHSTLLKAFGLLTRELDAELVIVGDGPLRPSLEAEAMDLGIAHRVTFAGFQMHPQAWMRGAHVFAHSSRWEGFGIVLLEALHAGCAIAATDCPGGVREVLAEGKYGILTPVGDAPALAASMADLLSGRVTLPNPDAYLQRFDLQPIARRYLDILLGSDAVK